MTHASDAPNIPLRSLLDAAVDIAWQAGRLTLGHFQRGVEPDFKADGSPVTIADRDAEQLIREQLARRFPDHDIVGEEFGEQVRGGRCRWWIDPIDGTQSFVHGVPLYGVLLGLEIDGAPHVGVTHFPALGETYAAATGLGAWWNGRRAHVSSTETLDRALMAYTMTKLSPESRAYRGFEALKRVTLLQRGWGDCYGHCLVATGRADVMLDPAMNPWDCAALVPLVQEAGGTFTSWTGVATIHGGNAISTNGRLAGAALATLARTL